MVGIYRLLFASLRFALMVSQARSIFLSATESLRVCRLPVVADLAFVARWSIEQPVAAARRWPFVEVRGSRFVEVCLPGK